MRSDRRRRIIRSYDSLLFAVCCLIALLVSVCCPEVVRAQDLQIEIPMETQQLPGVSAAAYCVINADTGEVILAENEHRQLHPASITKVMTLLVAAENCSSLDLVTTASEDAVQTIAPLSSTLEPMTKPGEQFTIRDLLYGLTMRSGNECGNILAEAVAGDVAAFADLMNQRAGKAGALNTHFCNPHGLDEEEHLTTAYDMAVITKAAIENPQTRKILSDVSYTIPATEYSGPRVMTSGHPMVNGSVFCEGVFAGKPGYTRLAQSTLVTAAEREGITLVAAVMHCDAGRAPTDTALLLEYAYAKLRGRAGSCGFQAYHPRVSDVTADGFTVTWEVGPEAVRAEFPVWIELLGTETLTRESTPVASDTISCRVRLADHGWNRAVYTVQAYVYNAAGQESVSTVKVLGGVEGLSPGFQTFEGHTYYVHENGTLGLQWQELEEGVYYFDYTTGWMHTGWIRGDTFFYMDPDGRMHTGWLEEAGKRYFFFQAGDMVTGRMTIEGNEYYFGEDGVLQEGVVLAPLSRVHE